MARTAAQIEASLARLRGQLSSLTDTSSSDPAASRLSGRGLRQQRQRSDSHSRKYQEISAKISGEQHRLALARSRETRAADVKAAPTSAKDFQGAIGVRTRHGAFRIVQVNKTTVTIDGVFGRERLPFKDVVRVMHPTPPPAAPRAASTAAGRSSGS